MKSLVLVAVLALMGCTNASRYEESRELVRAGVITDIHYTDKKNPVTDPGRGRFYSSAIPKTKKFVQEMNKEKVDFIIQLGDLTDKPQNERLTIGEKNRLTLEFAKEINEELNKFNNEIYHVFGNHDTDYSTKTEYVRAIDNKMVDIDENRFYYSFDKNGVRFIVLDASYHEDGRHLDGHKGYTWTDTYVPEGQLEWLREKLEEGIPSVIFTHQLIELGDDSVDPAHMIINAQEVKGVLEEKNNVLAVVQGHWHEGDYKKSNGIHYITMEGNVDYGTGVVKYNQYGVLTIIEESKREYEIVIDGRGQQDSYRLKRKI